MDFHDRIKGIKYYIYISNSISKIPDWENSEFYEEKYKFNSRILGVHRCLNNQRQTSGSM